MEIVQPLLEGLYMGSIVLFHVETQYLSLYKACVTSVPVSVFLHKRTQGVGFRAHGLGFGIQGFRGPFLEALGLA